MLVNGGVHRSLWVAVFMGALAGAPGCSGEPKPGGGAAQTADVTLAAEARAAGWFSKEEATGQAPIEALRAIARPGGEPGVSPVHGTPIDAAWMDVLLKGAKRDGAAIVIAGNFDSPILLDLLHRIETAPRAFRVDDLHVNAHVPATGIHVGLPTSSTIHIVPLAYDAKARGDAATRELKRVRKESKDERDMAPEVAKSLDAHPDRAAHIYWDADDDEYEVRAD